MPLKPARGIVGRAYHNDAALFYQTARRERGIVFKSVLAYIPHAVRRIGAERSGIVKIAAKLKVAPCIKRISRRKRQHLRKAAEFFASGRAARDKLLADSRRAHQPPFIMVAAEPQVRHAVKAAVFIYIARAYMAVVIDYGKRRGVVPQCKSHII